MWLNQCLVSITAMAATLPESPGGGCTASAAGSLCEILMTHRKTPEDSSEVQGLPPVGLGLRAGWKGCRFMCLPQ